MGEITIREIKGRDVQRLLETGSKVFALEEEVLGITAETLRREFARYRIASMLSKLTGRTDERFLVGEVSKVPIGTVAITRLNEAWYVSSVMVHPDYQGKGYGRALMNEACSEILRLGGKRAILHVRSNNEAAKKLYEASGFEVFEREVTYTRNAEDLPAGPLPSQYMTQKIGRFNERASALVDACREPVSREIYGPKIERGFATRMLWHMDILKKFERYAMKSGDNEWVGLFAIFVPHKTNAADVGVQLLRQVRGQLENNLLMSGISRAYRFGVPRVVTSFDDRFTELEAACDELGFQFGFRADGMVNRLS